MSDKSFGDHMNRNVVKNSLLSTAVTGLSLEDLTHNAVLLPVSLSQEVISRPDQTIVAQSRTLAHSDHAITNIPSGDANANLLPPNLPPYSSLHTFDAQQNVTPPKLGERPRSTLSKASVKSEDDFDVNEYFARLQGTRYVSAPINSGLKEDGNANLEATEENLEEINLNEEKEESVQQSLTADIAQNFSQLPTVLPQVASAVFSSFSNMLQTRKSREQTPDDAKPSGYQEVQFERPSEMANVVKEIAPPPREPFKEPPTVPPSVGTTSYRLPTKKKYAQIPGLTSRDNAQIPVQSYQMPPMSQNAPSYFVPGFDAQSTLAKAVENQPATSYYVPQEPSTEIGNNAPSYFIPQDTQKIEMIQDSQSNVPTSIGPQDIVQAIKRDESRYNAPSYFMPQDTQKIEIKELTESNKTSIGLQENVKVTQNEESNKNAPYIPPKPQPDTNLNQSTQISNTFAAQNIPIDNTVSQNQAVLSFDQKSTIVPPPQFFSQESAHAASVLPPPPMFSNTPQRDSQPGVGKSILPPSVARRIGAKQQVMKTPQISPFTENIFTPVPIGDDNVNLAQTTIPSQSLGISNQSAFASFNPQGSSPAFTPSSTINLTQSVPASIFTPSALQISISPSGNLPLKENFVPPPKSLPPLDKPPTRMIPPILAASYSQPFMSETSKIGEIKQSVPPSIFVPSFPTTSELTSQSSIPPPTMFSHPTQSPIDICPSVLTPPNSLPGHSSQSNVQPIAATISPDANAAADIPSVPMFTPSLSSVPVPPIPSAMQPAETTNFPPTAENTPKPMTEPPKATSNVNYRLTKKRPQYYAGPIEGVGSISNNIKPVIPELQTGLFQGALFTPQQDTTQHLFTPQVENVAQNAVAMDPIPFDISRPSEASYAPYEVTQPQQYPNPPQIDYNTTFDMSRPTTDNYSEPKDSKETGAFGLFGSLKSKLTSLDINKIQSSVTTFFDPAYNDTKKDTSNVHEYATYEQQQYTYPQYGQQASSIDIFVPNVEQSTPAYDQSYKYQTPDANQYNIVQNQQHYPSQDAYNYYQNPEQNTGYYTNPMQTYQAPSAIIPPTQPYYSPSFSSHGQDNLSAKTQSHENQQQNVKAKSSYSLVPPFTQVASPKEQETPNVDTVAKMDEAHTAVPSNTPSSKDLNVFKPAADLPQTESKNSLQFDDNATSFLDNAQRKSSEVQLHEKEPLQYDTQLKTDESINNFFNNPLTNVPHLQLQSQQGVNVECSEKEQQSKAEAIPPAEAEVPPTMFFDNRDSSISNLHKQNTKMSYMVKSKQEPVGTANVNLPDVMKQTAQQSKTELLENIDSNFTDKVKENESIDPAAAVNFFEHIPSTNLRSNFEGNDISVFTPHSREDEAQPSEMKDSEIKNIMFKLQTNPADFFGLFSQAEPTATGSFYTNVTSNFCDKTSDTFAQNNTATALVEEPKLGMSSALLFDLSSILANKSIEINDLRDNIEKLSIQKEDNSDGIFNPNSDPILFENIASLDEDDVSDLNICETCREVNKPESREEIDDVTNQMIENITSPIQLSNPVEVPLTECNTLTEDRTDFENNQCAEISHITEETIETIQVQSATELLEDEQFNTENRTYGWATDEASLSAKEGQNYSLPDFPGDINQKDFGLAIDPNTIGFFGNTLFEKVSNTDFTAKDTTVLLRQMSIPTAPPEEDDTKSETIDVHSIEQDAKQDFPLFEEFVIEPSGKDDNDDDTAQLDSFTSRVDKFQKKEEPDAIDKSSPVFELPATSPSLPIASYFDTGNYAAETHYRNSLTSPTNASYGSPNMRVPPGFEDQYQKLLYGDFTIDKEMFKQMPDTTTQTRPTYSPTYSSACNEPNATTNVTASSPLADISSKSEEIKVVQFTSDIIRSKTDDTQNVSNTITTDEKEDFEVTLNSQAKLTDSSVVEPKIEEAKPVTNIIDTTKPILTQNPLPDPINFFSSSAHNNPTGDDSVNRLASYFSSPDKTDHSKSFFELSQGQNHYRLEPKSEQTPVNIHNIPHEQYLANLNLMRDLTSVQNIDIQPETNVRTVNYFTIEYDDDNLLKDFNKGEPNNNKNLEEKIEKPEVFGSMPSEVDPELIENDETLLDVARKCEHCCNLSIGPVKSLLHVNHDILTEYKVRKCMDSNSEDRRASVSDSEKDMDHRGSISVNFDNLSRLDEEAGQGVTTGIENRSTTEYSPVKHHWFYRIDVEGKSTWRGFSVVDSKALEDAFLDPALDENTLVATDGGRFDVNVKGRLRFAVYWTDKPSNVRRCSWFYKGTTDARYVPYTEAVAEKLEDEYRHGMTTGEWHRRLSLPNNELVVMHGPAVMVHFLQGGNTEAFGSTPLFAFGKRVYRNPPKIRVSRDQPTKIDHLVLLVHGAGEYRHQKEKIQSTMRPRVVRRGVDESEIEEVDPTSIDHLLLLCHGVGSACDMRFRAVEEVVDDFRATSLQLIQSHYKNSFDSGLVGRVEVLPISWHATLHSGETGVDRRLARITLDSIPRLRNFTNDTVLDVLFYTSPVFCQTIINTVCAEMNRIYKLFSARNPSFSGGVSLGGHSLGSVILYDLLCHQQPQHKPASRHASPPPPVSRPASLPPPASQHASPPPPASRPASPPAPASKQYVLGAAGTGQPSVQYPALDFHPVALYALGSPIAIFECIRGVESLGADFALPTCKNFFNIFHPYDPIAYRIEPLVNPQLRDVKPSLIPHHKGRKRMHLELKDTMARVGADIKAKLIESIKSTWSNMWKTQQPPPDEQLEKVVEEEFEKEPLADENKEELKIDETTPDMLGRLNAGRRVDYVLQEAPFEMINEYLFAMSSHVCYWESEDTMLMMLREIYDSLGVSPDCTLPQHTLTVQRTRPPRPGESVTLVNTSECPSTSRTNNL